MIGSNIGNPLKATVGGLNFDKGFKYESQDISDYQVATPNPASLDKEVEKNLNIKLPTGKLDENVEAEFIDGLDEDGIINFSKILKQGYSYNAAKALYENKDKYKDITAEGISKYEKLPSQTRRNIGYGGGILGGLGLGLEGVGTLNQYGGKGLSSLGKGIYGMTIDPSINETRATQRLNANLNNAKIDLENAKKTGVGVDEAQKALDNAKSKVDNYRGLADTTYDYDIGEGITKNWTPSARGADARAKAEKIFTDTIEPALQKSKTKVNVQKLVDELEGELEGLAKLDPDKAEEYRAAFDELKVAFSDPKYKNLSLSEGQTLKSGLQGRTPQKFFKSAKFNSEREITNAYQELRGMLSTKLKDSVQNALTKEMGEDAAKLYKDYANLIEYADKQAYAATKGGFKGGAGKFMSSVREATGEPIAQKVGSLIGSAGDTLEKIGNKMRPSTWVKDAGNVLKSLGVDSSKISEAANSLLNIEKLTGKAASKFVDVLGKIARPVELGLTTYNIDKYGDIMATLPGMQSKLQWKNGNAKGSEYENWTEKDWEEIGLGKEDIRNILESELFNEFKESTSRGVDPYKMYYDLIK